MNHEMPLEALREAYRKMIRIRTFEEAAADLVEAGEVTTPCHLAIGQEAVAAGVCAVLTRDDYVWGGHRSHGHYIAKGGDLRAMMAEILGKATGCSRGRGGSMHLFAKDVGILGTVPLVAGTIPLAVGTALASKLREDGRVSVSFFGDGAVEEGHFHEAMNLAALQRLPVVFVCENNLYSSHLGLLERRAEDNIVDAGTSHGVPASRIDGNDVEVVHATTTWAVERARAGKGPSFLECRTYRWRGHVGPSWDLDVGVRRQDELASWMKRDPIARARARLVELGVTGKELDTDVEAARAEIEDAVSFGRDSPYPHESEVLDHVHKARV